MTHVLIWKNPKIPAESSSGLLLGWQRYDAEPGTAFRKTGDVGHLSSLAVTALVDSIARRRDATICQTEENPATTHSSRLDDAIMRLRPLTLVVPERPDGTRWVSCWCGSGGIADAVASPMAAGAIQSHLDALASAIPKYNQGGRWYIPPHIILRHHVNGESLGIVEPERETADTILGRVANDPIVLAANLDDYSLAKAREDAQVLLGIPAEDRAYQFSGEIESEIMPIVARMGNGDAPAVASMLRRRYRNRFRELGDRVLAAAIKHYPHGGRWFHELTLALDAA